MIGLVFDEEAEAKTFFKKVNNRKAEKGMFILHVTIRTTDTTLQQNQPHRLRRRSLRRTAKLIN